MSTENPNESITGEIVPPDTGIARTQAATIEELSQTEEGIVKLNRGLEMMRVLRTASIAATFPHDWVLFRAAEPTGDRITGYCQDAGCQRFADFWGIEIFDLEDFIKSEDPDTKEFSWSITGSGLSKRTAQMVTGITGVRYSYEDFITKRKLNRLRIDAEVKKAARANLHGSIIRALAGMKSVPVEELDQVWGQSEMSKYKNSKLCPHGRGFGSQAERQGAQVQQADDIQPGEEPLCEQCNPPKKMKFVAAGESRSSGKPYAAFWSCSAQGSNHKTIPHAEHMKKVLDRRQASVEVNKEQP